MTAGTIMGPHPPRQKRVAFEREISIKFKEFRGFFHEVVEDISVGGMFVRTLTPQPPGTVFDFEFATGESSPLISGIGKVVWVRELSDGPGRPAGMGICFLDLNRGSRELLYRLVERRVPKEAAETDPQPGSETGAPAESGDPVRHEPIALPYPAEEPRFGPRRPRASSYAVLARPERRRRHRLKSVPVLLTLLAVVVAVVFLVTLYRHLPRVPEEPAAQTGSPTAPVPAPIVDGQPALRGVSEMHPTVAEGPAPPSTSAADRVPARSLPAAPEAEPSTSPQQEPQPELEPLPEARPSRISAPPGHLTRLEAIRWRREGNELVVTLEGNGDFGTARYNHLRLDEEPPPRVLVRIFGIERSYPRSILPVGAPEVTQIRIGYHRRPESAEIHVVLDLADAQVRLTELRAVGELLVLRLTRQP